MNTYTPENLGNWELHSKKVHGDKYFRVRGSRELNTVTITLQTDSKIDKLMQLSEDEWISFQELMFTIEKETKNTYPFLKAKDET